MPPTSLIDSLQAVRKQVRRLAIGSGLGISVAAAIGLLVAVVLIDCQARLDSPIPRLLVILAALVALGYVVWHWVVMPAVSRLDISDVAGHLEHTFPQFDDRLSSTVSFTKGQTPGSQVMQARVIDEANSLAQQVKLSRVIVRRPVYYSAFGAVGSLVVLAGLITWGHHSGWLNIAANRLMLGDAKWPKTVEIVIDGEIPTRVAVGQRIPIKVHLARGDSASRRATVSYRYDNGAWQTEIMTRKDGAYTALLDAKLKEGHANARLEVRINSEDDQKELASTVVPRLQIAQVEAEIIPPTYVQPTVVATVNMTERPANAVYGSNVSLLFHFNKSLKPGAPVDLHSVKEGQKLPDMKWDFSTPGLAVARFVADASFRCTLKATDSDGLQNPGGEEYELAVKEDEPPTVQIEQPKRSEERTPNAAFDVKAVAEDDYGILGAQLIVDRVSGGEKSVDPAHPAANHWLVDLVKDGLVASTNTNWEPGDSGPERKRYHLGYHWDLASLEGANLKPGDVLEFFIQVKDNFRLNGRDHNWVPSGKLRITIISLDQFLANKQAEAELIQGQIKTEKLTEQKQKAETETLQQGLDKHKKFDEADKTQANRLSTDQASTQSQTMQLADRLAQMSKEMAENKAPQAGLKQTAEDAEKELRRAADEPMREAKKDIDAAKDAPPDPKAKPEEQAKDAEQRSGSLKKAAESEQAATDELQKALDKLGEMDGLAGAIEQVKKMREDQEKLEKQFQQDNKKDIGKDPKDLPKEGQDRLKKQADEQAELAKRTEQMLNNMDAKADKMAKSDPSASQAMKDAAQTGKTKALPSKQQQAAQDMQQNQQAQAQQGQHQIELGLDEILNKLKEAERKRLEQLAGQLAQMQQLIAELIGRQAGHNIDNLLIQGGVKRLGQIDSKDRDELFALSGRDAKNPSPAIDIDQLTPSQEQTHRNTVSIAKQAESLPDPAASTKLTQAAGQMERAIVHLRNNKPADAYQPPQVDALASLLDAKSEVDKAAQKVNDQVKSEDEQTIKQMYVDLLKEQKKVGADLVQIDATPKVNGDLPRLESIKLGQLPGEQGKLIDKAQKIGELIKKLDSVVYDWANQDIIKSMGTVKDNLAKPDTGKPTQVAEIQTEEELQAMIDSLVKKKNESPFDSRNNGGKSGGGSPKAKLPTEAELRLLKHIQEAVNKGTQDANNQKEKDKEQLLALGTRQSDVRDLFDRLIQKATGGQSKLGPPPDPNDQLPEQATKEDVDNKELDNQLLNDKDTDKAAESGVKITGDRMWQSKYRLATRDDPGAVTQEIQRRIVMDIDQLIKVAQQQQSQSKPGQPKPGDKPGQAKPQPGEGPQEVAKGNKPAPKPNEGGKEPAQASAQGSGSPQAPDLNANIKEALEEWGRQHPRDRQAVQEGAGDEVIGKYSKLVEDYYRSLSEQASKR